MQRLELTQNFLQTLRQEQIMAPQQIQALEILLATVPELEQKISEELAQNPTLELVDHGTEQLAGNPIEGDESMPAEADAAAMAVEKDEALAGLVDVTRNWMDYASPPNGGGARATGTWY